MQTTNKYNDIFTEAEKVQSITNTVTDKHLQAPTSEKPDREVLATEIKAMIAKAYSADEPNNLQS